MSINLKRVYRLLLNDLILNRRLIVITSITIAIFWIIFSTNNFTAYYISLFFGGFILTGSIFNDLHNSRKATFYLMLPCSNVERFLSKWLLSSLGYALILLVAYYLFSLLSIFDIFNTIFTFHYQTERLNIFQDGLWGMIFDYILFQSFIFLGSLVFKKYAVIKTAFVAGCFIMALAIFLSIVTKNVYLNSLYLWMSAHHIYTALLEISALSSLGIAYLKLTECELK